MQLKVLNSNQFVSSNLSAVDCECDVEKIFLATQVRQRCYDIIPVVVPSKAKKLFWVIGSHACFANFNFGQILISFGPFLSRFWHGFGFVKIGLSMHLFGGFKKIKKSLSNICSHLHCETFCHILRVHKLRQVHVRFIEYIELYFRAQSCKQ